MATSKINQEDAQEWLESLQLSGEGWYRNLALAVKANAHKALGMERREFAQQIGQRMIDSREAVVELHREGHSQAAISDVLGVSHHTVKNVLIEEGVIEGTLSLKPGQTERDAAESRDSDGDGAAESRDLQAEVDRLTAQVKGEQAKRKREKAELREEVTEAKKNLRDQLRKAKEEAEAKLTRQERERAMKEAEAWAEEQAREVLAGLAKLGVQGVIGSLEEATDHLQLLIKEGGLTDELIQQIEEALAAFNEEVSVAKVTAGDSAMTRR